MGEETQIVNVDVAATSEVTASSKRKRRTMAETRESRIKNLEKYRWQKGQSGNVSGSRMKLPVSDTLRALSDMPLPKKFRKKLQRAMGVQKLPKELTFLQGFGMAQLCRGWAPDILKGFDVSYMNAFREAIEGKTNVRISIPGEELLTEAGSDGAVDIRERIMLGIAKMMRRRSEMYDLKVPLLDEMETQVIDEMASKRKTG